MEELIEKYFRYLKIERNSSDHTIISYKNDLNQFLEFTAGYTNQKSSEIDVNSIDRLIIRLWLGDLSEKGMARSTVARKVASVRSFFKYCYKRGAVVTNPAHLLIVPKIEKKLPKTIQPEEIQRMMELANGDEPYERQNRAILELFYSTGMRLSELVQLNMSDLDFQKQQVTITGKGNKQRIVPLGKKAIEACKAYLEVRNLLYNSRTDSDARSAMFLAPGGQRIYDRKIQKIVKNYLMKASEVSQKSPHVLRHSFATHMLDAGADIRIIKEFLGHASLSATQIYTHTSVERLKKVYNQAHPRAEK